MALSFATLPVLSPDDVVSVSSVPVTKSTSRFPSMKMSRGVSSISVLEMTEADAAGYASTIASVWPVIT